MIYLPGTYRHPQFLCFLHVVGMGPKPNARTAKWLANGHPPKMVDPLVSTHVRSQQKNLSAGPLDPKAPDRAMFGNAESK